MKECQNCFEEVRDNAKKCPYCQSSVENAARISFFTYFFINPRHKMNLIMVLSLILPTISIGFALYIGSRQADQQMTQARQQMIRNEKASRAKYLFSLIFELKSNMVSAQRMNDYYLPNNRKNIEKGQSAMRDVILNVAADSGITSGLAYFQDGRVISLMADVFRVGHQLENLQGKTMLEFSDLSETKLNVSTVHIIAKRYLESSKQLLAIIIPIFNGLRKELPDLQLPEIS